MTNIDRLTNQIREKLPHLKELGDGCVVLAEGKPSETTIGRNGYSSSTDGYLVDDQVQSDVKHKYRKITKIIGKEPMLNDVLYYIQLMFDTTETETKVEKMFLESEVKKVKSFVIDFWDLRHSFLKEQSKEFIDRFNEIMNKPEIIQFQVTETYSDGAKVYHYFKSYVDEDKILRESVEIVQRNYQKKLGRKEWDFFTNTDPSKPTLQINEYPIKKGGLKYKVKWR